MSTLSNISTNKCEGWISVKALLKLVLRQDITYAFHVAVYVCKCF